MESAGNKAHVMLLFHMCVLALLHWHYCIGLISAICIVIEFGRVVCVLHVLKVRF